MKYIRLLFFVMAALSVRLASAQYFTNGEVKAHDFEGVTIDGRPYHLYESSAERILICFWSADCDDCHAFLKKLRCRVNLKRDYELVTFALADSKEEVQREVKKLKLPGWHFYDDGGWDGQVFLDYDINTAPTVVLIDKNKNIVGEAYDWQDLKGLLRGYEK